MPTFTSTTAWAAAALAATATLTSQVASADRVSVSFPSTPSASVVAALKPMAVAALKPAAKPTAAAAVAALKPFITPSVRQGTSRPAAAGSLAEDALRPLLKFETVRWQGKPVQTLDEASRLMLARAAAERAGLHEVGLSHRDLYGIIEAETSWIQRTGASKDGTPNLGLAQFEPRTAKGLGLKDPEDPVQAVFAAAKYIKDGARWASNRLTPLKLQPAQHAAKLREGVSVHYNLSIKGRNKWDPLKTADLPVETQRHIRNAMLGAQEAAQLEKLLRT